MQTFSEIKKSKFKGLPPELKADLLYVETLASATSTNISDWDMKELLADVTPGKKQDINQRFFAAIDKLQKSATVTAEMPWIKDIIVEAEKALKNRLDIRKKDYIANQEYARCQAMGYFQSADRKLQEAWKFYQDSLAVDGRLPDLEGEMKKMMENQFWYFYKFLKPAKVIFRTRNRVVVKDVVKKLGVDLQVDMGHYLAEMDLASTSVKLQPGGDTLMARGGFFNPYVDQSGNICWGNASETASKLRTQGKFADVLNLLTSLVSNYSSDTTPYISLSHFAVEDGSVTRSPQLPEFPPESDKEYHLVVTQAELCPNCDLVMGECECARCERCDALNDDCDCGYCAACDIHFRSGDGCDGIWCTSCDSCVGRDHCEEHHCGICGEDAVTDGECGNGCCDECDEIAGHCNRCRDCESHGVENPWDHESSCPQFRPEPETEQQT